MKLMEAFKQGKSRERDQAVTLFGPHRDDLVFQVNGRNVQNFGSQGQQRTTVLSLKLAEIECMNEVLGSIRSSCWMMSCQNWMMNARPIC